MEAVFQIAVFFAKKVKKAQFSLVLNIGIVDKL